MLTLTTSQRALLESIDDRDMVPYETTHGLELHDVVLSGLFGTVVSIVYPYCDLQRLLRTGLVRAVLDDCSTGRAYYEVTAHGERVRAPGQRTTKGAWHSTMQKSA